jgi:hypothetical protein
VGSVSPAALASPARLGASGERAGCSRSKPFHLLESWCPPLPSSNQPHARSPFDRPRLLVRRNRRLHPRGPCRASRPIRARSGSAGWSLRRERGRRRARNPVRLRHLAEANTRHPARRVGAFPRAHTACLRSTARRCQSPGPRVSRRPPNRCEGQV